VKIGIFQENSRVNDGILDFQERAYTIRRFKNGYWHETKGDTKTLCRRS
jgi:hypothetical protein